MNQIKMMKKKGQEEMVGFVLIVIVVSVILLFFLFISFQGDESGVESHEAESFVSAFLSYTTDCKTGLRYSSVQDLVFECVNEETCSDGRNSCVVLNNTLEGILDESWQVGSQNPNKGYELRIVSDSGEITNFVQGNTSSAYKGSLQNFAQGSDSIDISFRVYS